MPFYFFTGIRNPETKVNTIVSSILLISASGLLLTLMRSPKGTFLMDKQLTLTYLKEEQLLQAEIKESISKMSSDTSHAEFNAKGKEIVELCETIKKQFIQLETESKDLQTDHKNKNIVMHDHTVQEGFANEAIYEKTSKLAQLANEYDAIANYIKREPIDFELRNKNSEVNSVSCFVMLNQLIQVQRNVLQNERALLVCK